MSINNRNLYDHMYNIMVLRTMVQHKGTTKHVQHNGTTNGTTNYVQHNGTTNGTTNYGTK